MAKFPRVIFSLIKNNNNNKIKVAWNHHTGCSWLNGYTINTLII